MKVKTTNSEELFTKQISEKGLVPTFYRKPFKTQ